MKKKYKAYMILAFSISLLVTVYFQSRDTKQTKKREESPHDVINVDDATARILCTHSLKDNAVYDFKDAKFSNKEVYTTKDGDIMVDFKDAKYQNAFGAWSSFNGYCLIEGRAERWKVDSIDKSILIRFEIF